MDEITFEDVLTHYQLKIKEAYDDVETLKNDLKKAQAGIEAGWSGAASEACFEKLEAITQELTKTLAELSQAQVKLTVIGDLLADGESLTV